MTVENETILPGRITPKGVSAGLHPADARALAAAVHGSVVRPGDAGYDQARAVWNGRIEGRPALIVRAADAADVVAAVNFAREQGLPLAVRGAGHHPAGYGTVDAGLVLDLAAMKGLAIDPVARTAQAQPGLTAGEFFHAIHAQNLIVTVGSHPTVGLAGLTLGGGLGLLMGRYGLTCDNLQSAELVTADGRLVTAGAAENPDLFWAIRGGGGSFGIVTSLTYRLHPVEPTLAGMVIHPLERTGEVLRFFRDFSASAPDALGALAALLTTPDGHTVCALLVCHTGPLDEGERVLAPLRAFGPPLADTVQPMPYTGLLDMFQGADPAGGRYDYSARGLTALTDEAIDTIADFGGAITSPGTAVVVYHQHGAAGSVPVEATAYAARRTPYLLGIYAGWPGGDDAPHRAWCDRFRAAIEPHTTGASYLNLTGDAGEGGVRAAYGANYARLRAIKAAWDPDNLFRRNPNIPPV